NAGDPIAMVAIPLYGLFQSAVKGNGRVPPQLALDLAAVDGIAAVMSPAVFDVAGQGARLAHRFQQGGGPAEVGPLAAPAHVIHFADSPRVPDAHDGGAVDAHMNPVAHVQAVPVDGYRFIPEQVCDE